MKKLTIIGIWLFAIATQANAQEQLSIRQQADKLFERYEYFKSVTLYLRMVTDHKPDAVLFERIADCYHNINRYEEAEQWYAKAVISSKASNLSHFNYAEVLLRNQKFDLAKQQYKIYFKDDVATLTLKLAVCDSAALWMRQPTGYKVKNEESLNTEYSDWGVTYDGKTGFIFTSDRITDDIQTDNRTGNSWFKLYQSDKNGGGVKQIAFENKVEDIFNDEFHIGPIALNSHADTAYITIATGVPAKKIPLDKAGKRSGQKLYTRRLQLVMASEKDGQWTIFDSFPYNDIQKYSVGNAALSKDGRVIYFTSDMPGGEGKTDIWYCEKRAGGAWGNPVNCGKTINTGGEEDFPAISGDDALYYSSKGLPGMGGFDIFKATGEKAQWSTPVNLKFPINTTSDDFYLVTNDGLSGYISSNREGGKGSDDIYSFNYKPAEKPPVKPVPVTRVDTLVPGPSKPVKSQQLFVLKPIYYDLDKSNIRPDAALELDKLVVILKEHPAIKIELSSYTDSRASDKYNIALSQRRAASVVDYLAKNGIAPNRMLARYYGETHPVNNCTDGVNCTEAEHQLNRRTEFRVITE